MKANLLKLSDVGIDFSDLNLFLRVVRLKWLSKNLLKVSKYGIGFGFCFTHIYANHLLFVVSNKGDSNLTRHTLDDWYGVEQKVYTIFAANYQMNGELRLQEEKIEGMEDWCENKNISYTMTLFIN